ncbi:MAG TPA: hypothetical protein VK633_09530, partial [Verrucomicrobiae bacterium]|nr:hypothetical protein [Verrucomicrobiae bacterium]
KSPPDCPKVGAAGEPLIGPIFEYKNKNGWQRDPEAKGISVTGGYVYRGKALPALQGQYVFGDWSSNWGLPDGAVFSAKRAEDGTWSVNSVETTNNSKGRVGAYVTAFGQDAEGELYVLTNGRNTLMGATGKVFKIVPAE